jgi:hypothetical protein
MFLPFRFSFFPLERIRVYPRPNKIIGCVYAVLWILEPEEAEPEKMGK